MPPVRSGRPGPGEFADYAAPDIARVPGDDACAALDACARATLALFAPLDEAAVAGVAYAAGKWTIKEVLGHLVDDERIFAYRALTVARGDATPQPGFDEQLYVASAGFETQPLAGLLADYRAVRAASLSLFRGLSPEAWQRRGTVNGYSASPRGLAFHIVGHEMRHVAALTEKYLPLVRTPERRT